jgi:alpha-glucoside transport system substrate-binding protein
MKNRKGFEWKDETMKGLRSTCLVSFLVLFILLPLPSLSAQKEKMAPVHIMGVWGGEELNAFRDVAAGWEKETGWSAEFEGTRDLAAVLRSRVMGGHPPDLAVLPNPALMKEFVRNGKLKPLDNILEIPKLRRDYSGTWLRLGSVDGTLFSLFVKATIKSTIWYSPKEFAAKGWEIPKTWKELISLSDRLVAEGKVPWSIAVESGGASGWPASDWIQEIFLHESGPNLYDRWVAHRIPWTHQAVKSAFEKFGKIALGPGYTAGGVQAILATHFIDGSYLPFLTPPMAYMVFLGSFTQAFIANQFPRLKPGKDYDFFPFPTIDSKYAGAVTGAADGVVMFRETPTSRSFLRYMSLAEGWEPWAKRGGFTSPNHSMPLELYPDPLSAKVAKLLTTSSIFRFDADDLMPAEVQNTFWKGIMDYLRNPHDLESILKRIEEVAREAY